MAHAERHRFVIRVDPIERHLFLEGVLLRYGYDFRQYAEASLDRRLSSLISRTPSGSLLDALKTILASPDEFRRILPGLTINTTEFFRDPLFFRSLREKVFPVLKTYPKVNIWLAGCSTGEEVISMAIALSEDNLLSRSTIYATDINPDALRAAKEGIYDAASIPHFNRNYVASGGAKSPSDYYTAEYGLVRFHRTLLENVVFSEHNLATDGVFTEAHLVICRNVLIYFSRPLQARVFDLLRQSLVFRGHLGLGSRESIRFSGVAHHFETIDNERNLYSLRAPAFSPRISYLSESVG